MARPQHLARSVARAIAATAVALTIAVVAAACGFFTPAREAELVDIGCVILHYELPDSELAQLCHLPVAQVSAARAAAVSAHAASLSRPTLSVPVRDTGADQ